MKVLLINPPIKASIGIRLFFKPPPLSLTQLAGTIPNHEVEILDLHANPRIKLKDLEQKISKADYLGITCNSNVVKVVLNLCRLAKKNGNGIK